MEQITGGRKTANEVTGQAPAVVPEIPREIETLMSAIDFLGKEIERLDESTVEIQIASPASPQSEAEPAGAIRGAIRVDLVNPVTPLGKLSPVTPLGKRLSLITFRVEALTRSVVHLRERFGL